MRSTSSRTTTRPPGHAIVRAGLALNCFAKALYRRDGRAETANICTPAYERSELTLAITKSVIGPAHSLLLSMSARFRLRAVGLDILGKIFSGPQGP
jgi:hypothetical protein